MAERRPPRQGGGSHSRPGGGGGGRPGRPGGQGQGHGSGQGPGRPRRPGGPGNTGGPGGGGQGPSRGRRPGGGGPSQGRPGGAGGGGYSQGRPGGGGPQRGGRPPERRGPGGGGGGGQGRPGAPRVDRDNRERRENKPREQVALGEERLQKILAHSGIGSRRACEELILQGRVTVNGKVVRELGTKVDPGKCSISVDGQRIHEEKHVYFAVYKPKGYVSTNNDPSGRPRVLDLMPELPQRVYTIGRLDEASTGLLLLTNDGELANRLAHPKFGVEKIYRVVVAGSPAPEILNQLTEGIWLAEGKVKAKRVRTVGKRGESTILEMVLAEGKNREVRRMLAKLGHKVMSLTRVAVGPISIKGLKTGEYRPLTGREIDLLHRAAAGEFTGPEAKSKRDRPKPKLDAPRPTGLRPAEGGDRRPVLGPRRADAPRPTAGGPRSGNGPRPAGGPRSGNGPRPTGGPRPVLGPRPPAAGEGPPPRLTGKPRPTAKPAGPMGDIVVSPVDDNASAPSGRRRVLGLELPKSADAPKPRVKPPVPGLRRLKPPRAGLGGSLGARPKRRPPKESEE